jgi:selenocysteine lyase/cysteine desulfurase
MGRTQASVPGIILPVKELIHECHKRGILVMIDGAHCPGHIDIDMADVGADFYVGDLHKWLFNPRGSAFLWAKPE